LSDELFYKQPEALLILILFGLLLLAAEVGYQFGRQRRNDVDEMIKFQTSNIQGGILGILGLLLGFTFAMAITRYEARKSMVVDEANAIGTASLRGRLLPAPHQTQVADLFKQYVEARIQSVQLGSEGQVPRDLEDQVGKLQEELWSHGVTVAEKDPRSVSAGLFLQALNEVFDVKEKRAVSLSNHVPESALLLLAVTAMLALGIVGYGGGIGTKRVLLGTTFLALSISLVILIIIDFDRPGRGLIRVNQQSMLDLKASMNKAR
jgi:hypothetical protein